MADAGRLGGKRWTATDGLLVIERGPVVPYAVFAIAGVILLPWSMLELVDAEREQQGTMNMGALALPIAMFVVATIALVTGIVVLRGRFRRPYRIACTPSALTVDTLEVERAQIVALSPASHREHTGKGHYETVWSINVVLTGNQSFPFELARGEHIGPDVTTLTVRMSQLLKLQ